MKIFIDNGHGQFTPGKRSPDGQFREYHYNRLLACRITSRLQSLGYDSELLVPEDDDISLKERCRRVNAWCLIHGAKNALCISIHFNAHGNGSRWTQACGWSIYTSKGQTAADQLATCLCNAALKNFTGHRMCFDWSDGDPDQEAGFYILKHTLCPAVLTESFFMDNRADLAFLQSRAGKQAIIDTHIEGIKDYLASISRR